MNAPTIERIKAAHAALQGQVIDTPCLYSQTLSDLAGCALWLKFENLQFTAAFKERGAYTKLASLDARERAAGVIAASAGNHAQGVAYHAQRLGIPATIVMPVFAPTTKVARTRAFGATVVLEGDNFDEAKLAADRIAVERALVYVHPYEDADVIAGQGSIGLEMLRAQPDLDVLVVPIGGGGLISGMAIAAKALKPDIHIIGVQTERFPSMWAAMHHEAPHFSGFTIADGIAVMAPGVIAQEVVARLVDDVLLVDEGDIEQAIVMLLEIEKTVVEGAGAAGLAAVLRYRERFAAKKVGLVLCGGNIDPLVLSAIIERGMARSGRLARIAVAVRDAPGGLAAVAARLGALGANIDEIHHQRTFSLLAMQSVEVEFVVRTRGDAHVEEIVAALTEGGFPTRRM